MGNGDDVGICFLDFGKVFDIVTNRIIGQSSQSLVYLPKWLAGYGVSWKSLIARLH